MEWIIGLVVLWIAARFWWRRRKYRKWLHETTKIGAGLRRAD
jgi:hypothetical protein